MIWDVPRPEHDKWIMNNVCGLDYKESHIKDYSPTKNAAFSVKMLELFLKNDEEYSWVEMGYDSESDDGWHVIIHSSTQTEYTPGGTGWGWGMAWAICQALYNLIEEREQRNEEF